MKKIATLLSLLVAVVFFLSLSGIGNSQDQDKKVVKKAKQTVQNLQQKDKSCDPKLCATKHAKGECTDHEAGKCDPKLCAEKHVKGECEDHEAGNHDKSKCTGDCTDHTKKVETPKKLK
jgi:hypothetical protein